MYRCRPCGAPLKSWLRECEYCGTETGEVRHNDAGLQQTSGEELLARYQREMSMSASDREDERIRFKYALLGGIGSAFGGIRL